MSTPPAMRGQRLLVGLILATAVFLPAAYIAVLLGTAGDKPARDILFLIFYVAIAATLSANAAIAFTLSIIATLGKVDQLFDVASPQQVAREGFPLKARQMAQQDRLPPIVLVGLMLAPIAVLLLIFGAWLCTALYRAGSSLFLAATAIDLVALSTALLVSAFLVGMAIFHRAKKAAEAEDPNAR